MLRLSNKTEAATVSADFQHALMRQVMRTELIRVKALIGTAAFITIVIQTRQQVDPYAVEHLWHGGLTPTDL